MKYIFKIFYFLVLLGFEGYTQTCDLQFVVVNIGTYYDIKVQIRGNNSFRIGTSNITFNYNKEDLSNPMLLTAHNFNSEFYDSIDIGNPSSGIVSINIVFNGSIENGMIVNTAWTDLVSIRFNIDNPLGNSGLSFRNITPNKTGVFKDDNFTLIDEGYWMQENTNPLPVELNPVVVKKFELFQNYPNPFNPVTNIKFSLPHSSMVKLDVYNIIGQLVQTIINQELVAGFHNIVFNGDALSSGTYIYKLQTDKIMQVKKMQLLK